MAGYLPTITFDKAEGRYKLVRDWTTHPPTADELESQYIANGYATHLLSEFCRHYGAGSIVAADGLNDANKDDLGGFLRKVALAMETAPAASTGGSE